jgi:hypothetical protein
MTPKTNAKQKAWMLAVVDLARDMSMTPEEYAEAAAMLALLAIETLEGHDGEWAESEAAK